MTGDIYCISHTSFSQLQYMTTTIMHAVTCWMFIWLIIMFSHSFTQQ